MTVSRPFLPAFWVIACLNFAGLAFPAHADTLQDVSKALRQGQHAQALEQVDKYLASKPKDAQGRFLRGVILTEMNRNSEAISVFTKLTEDYPDLPEPYNNLAVIYAQQKQYDKAKQALETAIRTHPAYATAHENLGDLYARLASQAYDKALQLDSSNSSAQSKMALIRDLVGPGKGRPGKTEVAAAEPSRPIAPPATPVAPPAPTVVAPPPTKPEPPKAEPKPEPKTEVKPPEAKPEPPKVDTKTNNGSGDVAGDVAKALEAWASAWSRKDVKAYLARYAKDFKTPNGETRAAWEAERNKRINKPGKISVGIENLKVVPEGADQVTARFRQHYKSASMSASSTKVVVLVKREGKWLIQQERVGG